jgi:hypothetical protein
MCRLVCLLGRWIQQAWWEWPLAKRFFSRSQLVATAHGSLVSASRLVFRRALLSYRSASSSYKAVSLVAITA